MGSDKKRNGVKNLFPENQKKEVLLPLPYAKPQRRELLLISFTVLFNMLSAANNPSVLTVPIRAANLDIRGDTQALSIVRTIHMTSGLAPLLQTPNPRCPNATTFSSLI